MLVSYELVSEIKVSGLGMILLHGAKPKSELG